MWDGSTKWAPHEITMNEITPTHNEAAVTFGYVHMAFMIWIYNLRITFPDEEILLAYLDITACFRWPKINPDLIGAFGFVACGFYFLANAMVFGSTTSASSWEPFRRGIQGLATFYFADKTLKLRHKKWLDMVRWSSPPDESVRYVQALPCELNVGIIDDATGEPRRTPHFIYVDDDILADTRSRMPDTLAAGIQAIFDVLGWPMLALRAIALSVKKWKLLEVAHLAVLLGLVFDTRQLEVGITDEYREEVLQLMETTWHDDREAFTVAEIEQLIGKLGRIGQAFRPIYHLMPHLYSSAAYALRDNTSFLVNTSADFRRLLKTAKRRTSDEMTDADMREIRFAIGQMARRQHKCDEKYRMPITLKNELRMIRALLRDVSIKLSTPLAHIVPRKHSIEAACDACKEGGGGWSVDLDYWFHVEFDAEIVRRARLKNNKRGKLISINCLEFFMVIVNLAAAICALAVGVPSNDPNPVLLNWCDNTSACAWVNHHCKTSPIGRRLALIFVGLLLNANLGIQAEYISTHLNFIADEISRAKRSSPTQSFDFSTLLNKFPQLQGRRQFVPSPKLLTLISNVLLNNAYPDPLEIKEWRPETLGSFISSSS